MPVPLAMIAAAAAGLAAGLAGGVPNRSSKVSVLASGFASAFNGVGLSVIATIRVSIRPASSALTISRARATLSASLLVVA